MTKHLKLQTNERAKERAAITVWWYEHLFDWRLNCTVHKCRLKLAVPECNPHLTLSAQRKRWSERVIVFFVFCSIKRLLCAAKSVCQDRLVSDLPITGGCACDRRKSFKLLLLLFIYFHTSNCLNAGSQPESQSFFRSFNGRASGRAGFV